ncbi:hypothetical protein L208DRAFT_1272172 [Tricholoma matsutake]|nr:hypothetical protein L208DRAFT_1272172 [Tricholoma matsutake 945]
MHSVSAPTPRASLLAGLRTGGVRSIPPHSVPPPTASSPEQHQSLFVNHSSSLDAPNPQPSLNPNTVPFTPAAFNPMMAQQNTVQNQAIQMQMLQLEVIRMQTIQAQQMQAEILAQAHLQQQQQQQVQAQARERRPSLNFPPPATAGPLANSFDLRSATLTAQMRRAYHAEQMKSQLGVGTDQVPMTAALGGKFGSRTMSLNATAPMQNFPPEDVENSSLPPTPNSTTVISGGTSLGGPVSNNVTYNGPTTAPSKSDMVTSWRRGTTNNSVLRGNNRTVSSPVVKVTPPLDQQPAPPIPARFRPQPLRFSPAAAQHMPAVAIDTSSDSNDDGSSSSSTASNSSPTTPKSSASSDTPLSPREEASKKLYEGLGIGRPPSAVSDHYPTVTTVVSHRMASQPTRQPRGPPSGAEELGPKNFATRIRRKAIGGLGMLMGARERRELVEAY